jgi:hypothetical protein
MPFSKRSTRRRRPLPSADQHPTETGRGERHNPPRRGSVARAVIPRLGQCSFRSSTSPPSRTHSARSTAREDDGRPLSLRTVRYCRFILAASLDEAQRRGLRADNPAQLARVPAREHPDWRPRSAPQQPWSVDELRRFLRATAEDRLAALWITYVRSGTRRGELLALTWTDDVVFDARRLEVRRTRMAVQTNSGRRVYDKPKPKSIASRRTITLDADNIQVLRAHKRRQVGRAARRWRRLGRRGPHLLPRGRHRTRPRLDQRPVLRTVRRGRGPTRAPPRHEARHGKPHARRRRAGGGRQQTPGARPDQRDLRHVHPSR